GLMIRSSLDPASPYAFVYLAGTGGNQFVTGGSNGVSTTVTGRGSWAGELRMVRRGNVLSIFHSDAQLTDVGLSKLAEENLILPNDVYIGFAVAGNTGNQPSSGDFSEIRLVGGSDVQPIFEPVLTAAPLASGQVQLSWTD